MDSKLQINDLLSILQQPSQNQHSQQAEVPDFISHLQKDNKIKHISKKKQELMKRELNYEMTKEEMDKWVGIVKLNREKQSLNFQQKSVKDLTINFFPSQPINEFHKKIEQQLQSMSMQSQKAVLKHESEVLQKVDPEQAKRRLIEARKHRTTVFYEEQKRRRIAKIKSKVYHKIKKRQKLREEAQRVDQMNPNERNQYIEHLTKKRIQQRITLRHKTKNRHIQNLLRFNRNQKNGIQSSINEVNELRRKQLERVNEQLLEQFSEEYDDENFRQEAMKDLEAEIQALERQGAEDAIDIEYNNSAQNSLKDLKFMQLARQKKINKQKSQAIRLFEKLSKGQQINEMDVEENSGSEVEEIFEESVKISARKVYGKKIEGDEKFQAIKNKSVESQINKYLLTKGVQQNGNYESSLIEGINLEQLQRKYQPERIPIDLATLIAENKEIYQNGGNEAVIENAREFQQQKMQQIEQQVEENDKFSKNKKMKGWGNWTGPGIHEKKVDPQEELRKKLKKIEEIKQKRKDNSLANVTINETRNKNLSDYFVRNLPHNFASSDQFDYMQMDPVGPEWNSLNQFKDNIKPKIITKVGQVITPAKLPKKMQSWGKRTK